MSRTKDFLWLSFPHDQTTNPFPKPRGFPIILEPRGLDAATTGNALASRGQRIGWTNYLP